jgi:hypothetical protein
MEGCDRRKREVVLRDAFDAFLRRLANWRSLADDPEALDT